VGLVVAQGSGNRLNETYLAEVLARLEAEHGDPLAALDYTALAIRDHHDSGNTIQVRAELGTLAALFNRLGHYEVAAIMSGFADMPYTRSVVAEINATIAHLREVLGDQTYESLAREGESMTTAEIASYAYDQIDQAREKLNGVSK
jgi:hypothetical protein